MRMLRYLVLGLVHAHFQHPTQCTMVFVASSAAFSSPPTSLLLRLGTGARFDLNAVSPKYPLLVRSQFNKLVTYGRYPSTLACLDASGTPAVDSRSSCMPLLDKILLDELSLSVTEFHELESLKGSAPGVTEDLLRKDGTEMIASKTRLENLCRCLVSALEGSRESARGVLLSEPSLLLCEAEELCQRLDCFRKKVIEHK
ncbi:unnamed protein product [Choristocarpus tenellus]